MGCTCDDDETRLSTMQQLVKRGEFREAELVGNAGTIPLAVSKTRLRYDIGTPLSSGAQASVFRAEWVGREPSLVAIKKAMVREAVDLVRFRREVQMLSDQSVRHENIVPLIGARMLPPDYLAIFELFSTSAGQAVYQGNWRPVVAEVLMIGSQIALALSHLHGLARPIIHRDVKPGNILLSKDRAVLGDFGIADYRDAVEDDFFGNSAASGPSGGFHKAKMLGTLEYMAPEILLKTSPASAASDVYALCVTLNELIARVPPYSDCTRDNPLAHTILEMGYGRQELATAVAAEGLRPTVPSSVPAEAAALLRRGWHADPSQRPTAGVVAKVLHRIATRLVDTDTQSPKVTIPSSKASSEVYSFGLEGIDDVRRRIETQMGAKSEEIGETDDDDDDDEWTAPTPPAWVQAEPSDTRPSTEVPVGVFATSGARGDAMEDRGLIIHQVCMSDDVLVAAVFDGHRGAEASDFLAANLDRLLYKHWTDSTSAADLLTRSLLSAEEEFRIVCEKHNKRSPQPKFPGTTALCMLLHGKALTVANIGDSRAMICRAGHPVDLTRDQVAGRTDERLRIERAGHARELRQHEGAWRVGEVGLAVTRSIGDYDVKPPLTAHPEVTEHSIGPNDEYVVMASDGVWDVLDGPDVVSIIANTVKQPAMAAQRIVHTAVNERYSKDNATAIVCFLQGQSTFERV